MTLITIISSRGGPNDVIDKKGLINLQFLGNPYPWSNKREGFANIKERLDRAFANKRWRLIFPRVAVHNLPASTSDHSPIVLFTEGEQRYAKKHLSLKRPGQEMRQASLWWKKLGGLMWMVPLYLKYVGRLKKPRRNSENGTKNGLGISRRESWIVGTNWKRFRMKIQFRKI